MNNMIPSQQSGITTIKQQLCHYALRALKQQITNRFNIRTQHDT